MGRASASKFRSGSSLVVQGLRLHALNAGGLGSIPGQRTRSHIPQLRVYGLQQRRPQLCPIAAKWMNACFLKSSDHPSRLPTVTQWSLLYAKFFTPGLGRAYEKCYFSELKAKITREGRFGMLQKRYGERGRVDWIFQYQAPNIGNRNSHWENSLRNHLISLDTDTEIFLLLF